MSVYIQDKIKSVVGSFRVSLKKTRTSLTKLEGQRQSPPTGVIQKREAGAADPQTATRS